MATLAAAWTPPESKNISTVYPSKKLVKIQFIVIKSRVLRVKIILIIFLSKILMVKV